MNDALMVTLCALVACLYFILAATTGDGFYLIMAALWLLGVIVWAVR